MKRVAHLLCAMTAAFAVLVLGGCAGPRTIESLVRTATPAPAPVLDANGHYRFERLPSQLGSRDADALEARAQAALAAVGWARDDASPRYSAEVGVRIDVTQLIDYGPPRMRYWGGGYFMPGPRLPPTYRYRYDLALLLRELRTGQIVYETHALHEGPWYDRDAIVGAMLTAALLDFPTPPPVPRVVKVQIGE